MPLIYGEKKKALFNSSGRKLLKLGKISRFIYLRKRKLLITIRYKDFSVLFSLSGAFIIKYFIARKRKLIEMRKILRSNGSR